ncbi:glycosyltransferase [Acidipropionibacterium virtanenii]|uniref:N-acetylglucosaminyl-diphospho-decaprenol L-rhamnosyltransferase n=1 Tax=Acidipropionibacterium virtanenii TaxID=2057246 RepID=A0A344UTT6_9ACTN|nr:glycosyltransferase [Acidipropionibacterium virtanenii]AXE38684.1 N-acetylglucosaminyl-diphospho-decaprenol L-rhamnosyltransferase [Acidipropionibacterium virtanenii]
MDTNAAESVDRSQEPRFAGPDATVDVAVIVVTYNSAGVIEGLVRSLREDAGDLSLRVIAVDNASTDGTPDVVARIADVTVIPAGGNLGYAAGINIGMTAVGAADDVLILNPDVRILSGCLAALRTRLRAGASCAVPAILDSRGELTQSLRREPTLLAAAGDALLGSRWPTRPGALSQTVRSSEAYRGAHPIDWATGAALLIDRRAAEELGRWDERFFLYSEETDFFHRLRASGRQAWFEPEAQVVHAEAGSGRPPELVALTIVNAVRYAQKHHPRTARPLQGILALHELRRWRDPDHRVALQALLSRRRWAGLPHATGTGRQSVDHLLVTRFNLPSHGPESLIRAREGWLQNRIELFERYTVPSVRSQTNQDFSWLVYLDPLSPQWLLDRLAPLVDEGLLVARYREEVGWQDVAADAGEVTGGRGGMLITTNLDNDDALAVDFVDRLREAALDGRRGAVYLADGLIRVDGRLYRWRDPVNAFCSVIETWEAPQTAWRDWHILLRRHMAVTSLEGPPGWLQIVHGRNVSNRIRGRLADPASCRTLFPGSLDDVESPGRHDLLIDALVARPARETREIVRGAGKRILLGAMGKNGLEQLKERFHAAR